MFLPLLVLTVSLPTLVRQAKYSHTSLLEVHVPAVSRHEGWHQGREVEVTRVNDLPSLVSKPPVGGHRETQSSSQRHAALVSYQIHNGEVVVLPGQLGQQRLVLQDHPAVDLSDAVEVSGQVVGAVRLVPDDWTLQLIGSLTGLACVLGWGWDSPG